MQKFPVNDHSTASDLQPARRLDWCAKAFFGGRVGVGWVALRGLFLAPLLVAMLEQDVDITLKVADVLCKSAA